MAEVFVEVKRDDEKNIYYVEKRNFKLGSIELKTAINKYNELVQIAINTKYSIEEKVLSKHKDNKTKGNVKLKTNHH